MSVSTADLPANYRTVLEVVASYGEGRHGTAQDIYARARERRPKIGFATVHRALARLHQLGLILKLEISGADSALYEPVTGDHAHFRCTVCGAVEDVAYACDPGTRGAIERQYGVAIRGESITFTGLCPRCAPSAAPGALPDPGARAQTPATTR